MSLLDSALKNAEEWYNEPFDKTTQNEISNLKETNEEVFIDAFYKHLTFGTGGLRGLMRVGSNSINKYTLSKATQALSNYLHELNPSKKLKVAIAYDCRNHNEAFSKVISNVLLNNDINVFLFEKLRPTPQLSFAVTHFNCDAGIVLTASHNPKEYNGYKVYWNDGGQLVPPHDRELIKRYNNLSFADITFNTNKNVSAKLHILSEEVDRAFIKTCIDKISIYGEDSIQPKIVFTPLHGTAIEIMPQLLKVAEFRDVHIVPEQATPDGNFSTVDSPNPEERSALTKAIEMGKNIDADLVFGTDPDADRVGFAVKDNEGGYLLLNGNQSAVLMTDFMLSHYPMSKIQGSFIASTIVTTDMILDIASHYGIECKTLLTGFKWIGEAIHKSSKTFVCGCEESFGFLPGDYVRDKDAMGSAFVFCQMMSYLKNKGSTILDYLHQLYQKHGLYAERLVYLTKTGHQGATEIENILKAYRTTPPTHIAGSQVVHVYDYDTCFSKNLRTGEVAEIQLPKSNVLVFYTEDGTKLCVRPSGTEPKIKFYLSVKTKLKDVAYYDLDMSKLEQKLDEIESSLLDV